MKKKTVLFSLLLIFCLYQQSQAYQYNDFRWYEPLQSVKEKIEQKDTSVTIENDILKYKDTLFDNTCEVQLFFTRSQKLLYMCQISWPDTKAAEPLKSWLIKKHGQPAKIDEANSQLSWADTGAKNILVYDYEGPGIRLTYSESNVLNEETLPAPANNKPGDTLKDN